MQVFLSFFNLLALKTYLLFKHKPPPTVLKLFPIAFHFANCIAANCRSVQNNPQIPKHLWVTGLKTTGLSRQTPREVLQEGQHSILNVLELLGRAQISARHNTVK